MCSTAQWTIQSAASSALLSLEINPGNYESAATSISVDSYHSEIEDRWQDFRKSQSLLATQFCFIAITVALGPALAKTVKTK